MKKIILGILLMLSLGLCNTSHSLAGTLTENSVRPIEVVVNGEFIKMDVKPLMDNNHLFVPIRALASLGLSYSFNSSTKITTVQNKDGDYLKISANSGTAIKNGKSIKMETPAQNKNGRILVPVRFVSESLGYKVQYESIRKFVFINSKDYVFDSNLLYQDDLQAARKAAIALPINADFKPLNISTSGSRHLYSFPVGRADIYYLDDTFYTFVQIIDGKAIAIGQLYRERRVPSQAAGHVSPDMDLDHDPFMENFNQGNVIFFENNDGIVTAAHNDDKNKSIKLNNYSDIIQKLPDKK